MDAAVGNALGGAVCARLVGACRAIGWLGGHGRYLGSDPAVAPGQGEGDVTEIRDDTTIGAIFAAAVIVPCRPPVPRHPGQRQARLSARGPRDHLRARPGARVAELSAAYASAGYGLGHRVATLLENRPEHVLHKLALQRHRRLLRADQSGLPGGRDRLPPRAQQARSRADARLPARARCARPWRRARTSRRWSLSERLRRARCRRRRGRRAGQRRRPRRRPASSTPPAPPGGPRAASSRTATRSRPAPGMRRSAAWQRCARARSASTIRCRSITPTPASCR